MSAAQLELAADILGPLVDEVVFVGGATIHLWLSEEGAPPARATDDVDVICCDIGSPGISTNGLTPSCRDFGSFSKSSCAMQTAPRPSA